MQYSAAPVYLPDDYSPDPNTRGRCPVQTVHWAHSLGANLAAEPRLDILLRQLNDAGGRIKGKEAVDQLLGTLGYDDLEKARTFVRGLADRKIIGWARFTHEIWLDDKGKARVRWLITRQTDTPSDPANRDTTEGNDDMSAKGTRRELTGFLGRRGNRLQGPECLVRRQILDALRQPGTGSNVRTLDDLGRLLHEGSHRGWLKIEVGDGHGSARILTVTLLKDMGGHDIGTPEPIQPKPSTAKPAEPNPEEGQVSVTEQPVPVDLASPDTANEPPVPADEAPEIVIATPASTFRLPPDLPGYKRAERAGYAAPALTRERQSLIYGWLIRQGGTSTGYSIADLCSILGASEPTVYGLLRELDSSGCIGRYAARKGTPKEVRLRKPGLKWVQDNMPELLRQPEVEPSPKPQFDTEPVVDGVPADEPQPVVGVQATLSIPDDTGLEGLSWILRLAADHVDSIPNTTALLARVEGLEALAEQLRRDNAQLSSTNAELNASLTQASQRVQSAEKEHGRLTRSLAVSDATVEELQLQLSAAQAKLSSIEDLLTQPTATQAIAA